MASIMAISAFATLVLMPAVLSMAGPRLFKAQAAKPTVEAA
jgi:uncharacterized membrane protein YdfJ with MMPL/SSD domain